MEGNVFPDPEVAGILSENFIEARLHLEPYQEAGGETWDDFAALRDKYAESNAMPTYAVVKPLADKDPRVGWHQLHGTVADWKAQITRLLESSMAEAAKLRKTAKKS